MLYFWINGLETTEEECFTQQQKVFVSVFSINFSLAWVSRFQLGKPTSGSASELHKLPTFPGAPPWTELTLNSSSI